MPAAGDVESERAGIIRTFHLHEARLAMEAGLIIGEGGQAPDRVRLPFSIEGRPYQIVLLITEFRPPIRLFAVVLERSAAGFSGVLAETLEMRAEQSTVLEFESDRGTHFLAFRITGPRDMLPQAPPPPPPPPRLGEEEAGFEEFARGAVKVDLDLIPPRLIKIVDPTLPAGRPAPAQGAHVSLYLRLDEQGRVVAVHSVYSTDKELERSAISAVRQWTYEPYLAEGKPSQAVIPVTVRFGPD
jgi:TonB family protein